MGHRARRHVAHVPAGLSQAPHQVHVLATAQRRIEEVRPRRHIGPDQQGRAGHEGDAAAGPHRPAAIAPVERRSRRLVAGGATGSHDARCHRRHQRIVEVAQQRPEPPVGRHAVGVHECDQRSVDYGQPGVARAGRADVGGQPDEACTVPLGDLLGGARVGRRVIDHDAGQTPEGIEHPVELCGPVAHRHHDRHVVVPEGAARRLRDERAPETNRRASSCAARRFPTAAPLLQRSTSCRARSEIRKRRSGLPPSSTVPPSNSCVDAVLGQGEGAGQRRRGPRDGRPQRGGHPGCARLGHRSILAVRGRG